MKKYKMIIVDDDREFTAKMEEKFINDEDIDLLCITGDGFDAIKKIESFKPDLVF